MKSNGSPGRATGMNSGSSAELVRFVLTSGPPIFVTNKASTSFFDEYGPAYVGLAKGERLGARLRDHRRDHLAGKWDRFSWFGFNQVGTTPDATGILSLNKPRRDVTDDTSTTIGDLEALLIAAMGPKLNQQKMRFDEAEKWEQIGYWEWNETYRARIASVD